jgi:capsid portal protein
MSKRNRAQRMSRGEASVASKGALQATASSSTAVQAFSFGEPVEVLKRREIMDMVECYRNDRWYEPRLSLDGLARVPRIAAP